MSLGLDLGTNGFRSLWKHDGTLVGRQTTTGYVTIPNHPAQAKLLERAGIRVRIADDSLIITGAAAQELSQIQGQPLVPLLPDASLPAEDPVTRQIAAGLVEGILPWSDGGTRPCAVVLPGDSEGGFKPGQEFFLRLLRLANYRPIPLTASHALALAELGRERLTGIAVTFGAGSLSLCLVDLGSPVITITTAVGGDRIDREIAASLERFVWDANGNRYLDTAGVRHWKEQSQRSILDPRDDAEWALLSHFQSALDDTLTALGTALGSSQKPSLRDRHLPVVCHGGGTCAVGFRDLFLRCWNAAKLPIQPTVIRLAGRDPWTVARGCVIHNEVESLAPRCHEAA